MAINEVLGLTLDLEANTTKFMKDLRKAAGSVDLAFNPKPLIQSFARAQSGIQKVLAGTVADAASAGFSKANISGLVKRMAPLTQQIEASNKRIFELSVEMGRKGIEAEEKERLKALRKVEKQKLAGLTDQFNLEKKNTDRLMERRKKAMTEAAELAAKEFGKGAAKVEKAGDAFATSIESAFAKVKSGDFAGLFKGMGGGASKMGKAALAKAQEGGATSGLLKSIGGLLSKIGPALAAIGAIAAGVAAVVAIAISADSAIKGLNKTLLDSGAAGIDLANKYNVLGSTLSNISQHFAEAFSLKNTWGTTAKDHMEILGAFSAAGVTFKQMREEVHGVGTEMDRLQKYTVVALTYSKLLGMSTQEISTQMATYMEELGYTLEGVQSRFSHITVAAKESGFATKRFLNMLFQATSGMSMYNVRLEEAAGLLVQLGKVLGQKMGGDFLQQLTKGFKDEGVLDRVKKTMTTGMSLSMEVLKLDAIRAAKAFSSELEKLDPAKREGMQQVLAGFGLDKLTGADLAKALSSLPPQQLGMLTSQVAATGGDAMARQLGALASSGQAFKGTLGGVQAARGTAGAGASLFLQLNEAAAVMHKSLDQIPEDSIELQAAFEQVTGKSGEVARQLRNVGLRIRGDYDTVRKAQLGGVKDWDKFNKQFSKSMGVRINAQGRLERITKGEDGSEAFVEIGDSLAEFFTSFGAELEKISPNQVNEDTELARDIASNTTEISALLQQGVEWFLSEILNAVRSIASFLGFGLSNEERAAKAKASTEVEGELEKLFKQMTLQRGDLVAKRRALVVGRDAQGKELSPEARKGLEEDIKNREGTLEFLRESISSRKAQLREIGRLDSSSEIGRFGDATRVGTWRGAGASSEEAVAAGARAYALKTGRSLQEDTEDTYQGELASQSMRGVRRTAPALSVMSDEEWSKAMDEQTRMLAQASHLSTIGLEGAAPSGVDSYQEYIRFRATPLDEVLGDQFIDSDKRADEREKKSMTEEEKQKQEMTKKVIDGIDKIEKDKEVRELAAKMAQLGMSGTAETLTRQARGMIEQGRLPTGIDYKKEVVDPDTGMKRRLGDILMSTHKGSAAFSSAMFKRVGPTPEATSEAPAHDFLMQVGEGGRVKFAQRIDTADTVTAVASKPGGAISQAKGSRGSSVIVNSFGNSAEVVRGIQAAVSAGVL